MSGLGGMRIVRDHRDEVTKRVEAAGEQALLDAGGELLRVANETVPKREGILEASGAVQPSGRLRVSVGYGGEAKAYAVRQHEDTTLSHTGGRRAKWLEQTFKEEGGRVAGWLRDTIKAAME